MGATLQFGTAGIRGEVGPGTNRMNRAMVIRTTAGLVAYLSSVADDLVAPVVVGFDARPSSRAFAEDTAGVIAATGRPVLYFPEVAPTPLVAFAAKHHGAIAAVVVTASHNPPADNGYKVYATNGAQIIPPWDVGIADCVRGVGPASEVPRVKDVFGSASELVTQIGDSIVDAYWGEVNASRPSPCPSELKVVYTPIHGVGGKVLTEVFDRAGHKGLIPVPAQMDPDGRFPTVSFPNPEEEGALDLALELASKREADVVIANDPDADRFAAAVPGIGEWRLFSGNELGTLLGDYVLRKWNQESRPIVVNSIVSSPIMGKLASAYGARHEATLTGFKWIVNAGLALEEQGEGTFAFGYEEALGYTVGGTVRDKDGISAALIFCDLVAGLREEGDTVLDRLYEIWRRVGLWVSAQHSIVRAGQEGQDLILSAVDRLGTSPPEGIGQYEVTRLDDFRSGGESRPFWLGNQSLIQLTLGESGRLLVRPSGTEPKLKIYVDLMGPLGDDPVSSHRDALSTATSVAVEMGEWLGI
jgi:phosphomannomutase